MKHNTRIYLAAQAMTGFRALHPSLLALALILVAACSDDPVSAPKDDFSVGYSGAQSGGWSAADTDGEVTCRTSDGAFSVEIWSSPDLSADRVSLTIDPFDGADEYTLAPLTTYRFDIVSLWLGEDFNYQLGYDYSRVTQQSFPSECTGTILAGDAAPLGRVSGHFDCVNLYAGPYSADYQEEPEDRQTNINVSFDFDCALEVL